MRSMRPSSQSQLKLRWANPFSYSFTQQIFFEPLMCEQHMCFTQ